MDDLINYTPTRRNRIQVSRAFRAFIKERFPALSRDPSLWPLFEHLAFGIQRKRGGQLDLLIHAPFLASLEGKPYTKHYAAWKYLQRFADQVVPITWSDWSYAEGQCRVITAIEWPEDVRDAIAAEIQRAERGEVYLVDGSTVNDAKIRQHRIETQQEAWKRMEDQGNPHAKAVLEYLNHLPLNVFKPVLERVPDALAYVVTMADDTKAEREFRVLRHVQEHLQPFYAPSARGRSVRAFPFNNSALHCCREVFQRLTQDYQTLDLKASQTAIAAKEWDVPLMIEFLEAGGSIWQSIADHLGIDLALHPEAKDVFKHTGMYPALYGRTRHNLIHGIPKEMEPGLDAELHRFGVENGGEAFLSHPLVSAMMRARDVQFKKIKEAGGAYDCFGTWIDLRQDQNERSILAQLAQATELRLMLPIFDLAKESNAFTIAFMQHDGCTIKIHDESRIELWMQRIEARVRATAKELGIPTQLERKVYRKAG